MRGLRVRNSISNEKRAVVTWPNSQLVGQVPVGRHLWKSLLRIAGFTSKWTGLVNTGRHIGTNLLFVERIV
jgi:hypothetical protein